jgi:hypothetical protein
MVRILKLHIKGYEPNPAPYAVVLSLNLRDMITGQPELETWLEAEKLLVEKTGRYGILAVCSTGSLAL